MLIIFQYQYNLEIHIEFQSKPKKRIGEDDCEDNSYQINDIVPLSDLYFSSSNQPKLFEVESLGMLLILNVGRGNCLFNFISTS